MGWVSWAGALVSEACSLGQPPSALGTWVPLAGASIVCSCSPRARPALFIDVTLVRGTAGPERPVACILIYFPNSCGCWFSSIEIVPSGVFTYVCVPVLGMTSGKRLASVQDALCAFRWSPGVTQTHCRMYSPGFGVWEAGGALPTAPEAPPEPRSCTPGLICVPSGAVLLGLCFASNWEMRLVLGPLWGGWVARVPGARRASVVLEPASTCLM